MTARFATAADVPDRYRPDWQGLARAESEGPFMEAGVELLKEGSTWAIFAAGRVTDQPLKRDEAIRCGLLVRTFRLARSSLRDTCLGDGDQQMALLRQLMDTVMTLLYLVDDEDGTRHTAYVHHSLVAEREFLKTIASEQRRTGRSHPVEQRIQRSIDQLAAASAVDLAVLPSRAQIGWPSAETLARGLGPTAYPAYRMGSASLHGTWQDLHRNYLEATEGGFWPALDPLPPRPQPLLAAAMLVATATATYLTTQPDDVRRALDHLVADLRERVERVDSSHERFLQNLPVADGGSGHVDDNERT